ncbi:MAG: hypothetical protein IMW90_21425 [Thermogemmatispora sp.]|uniref:hypothetical protein n=1 Tax=Thermogemmatispora TaxID=768669 RepID=UPI00124D6709|nr:MULTISPECIES: hypothetical protein [Thermogemmatispora]MBE3568287.1 hypothetical protein [Thermogemmatispora sp.]
MPAVAFWILQAIPLAALSLVFLTIFGLILTTLDQVLLLLAPYGLQVVSVTCLLGTERTRQAQEVPHDLLCQLQPAAGTGPQAHGPSAAQAGTAAPDRLARVTATPAGLAGRRDIIL